MSVAGPGIGKGREPILLGFVPAARDTAAPRGLQSKEPWPGTCRVGGSGPGLFPLGLCLCAWSHQEEAALAGVPHASLRRCGLGAFLAQG